MRVWVAAHEIEPLELVYELGDGLARDAGVRGEVAGAGTVVADVAQERGLRGRDIAEAVLCEIGADGGLERRCRAVAGAASRQSHDEPSQELQPIKNQ